MPKQKQFLKSQRKTGKRKDAAPQTADDYLAAGVDFEEAGEKWRAGDAQKSTRFFVRALDTYDAGLHQFARSFDLAYNKARLQYDLAQQPRLLQYLPGTMLDLLKTALDSHRRALDINQENTDLLFNTGQLLTSLGELITREADPEMIGVATADPLRLFQEALEFFQRCLSLQEYQLTQAEAEVDAPADASINTGERTAGANEEKPAGPNQSIGELLDDDHWATIVEPVTPDTLLDTLLAQVETLTSVCGLFGTQGIATQGVITRGIDDPGWVEQYYNNLLHEKIQTAAKETGREREPALTRAKLRCALAAAGFSTAQLDLPTYEREISAAYDDYTDIQADAQALCDRADAELAFVAGIRTSLERADVERAPDGSAKLNVICWKHLTKALDSLTAASKLPDAKKVPRIHLRRGDCEMHRRSLGGSPMAYDLASKSEPTLLRNAEIYYRGAARLAKAEAAADEEGEASIKEAVVVGLSGDMSKLQEKIAGDQARVEEVVEDMAEEGMISIDDRHKLGM